MSLPSVVKEKTSNKVSLVSRPNVTLIQPVQVIGSSASQPTLIYVQSIQPQATSSQHAYITTKVNKPKSLSQPVIISSTKPNPQHLANKFVAIPSTSSAPNRVQTFQLKSPNVVPAVNTQKPVIVGQTVIKSQIPLDDKQAIAKITKLSTASSFQLPTNNRLKGSLTLNSLVPLPTASNIKTAATNVAKLDPVKCRYRTILENLLQLKNNFVRRTITQAIQQKLCKQSNEDLLNVIFKSFELTLLSVNVEQIYLNETYLNATLAFLAKVIETGRFMELIENRKETKDITKFVTSEMSTILNKVSLESVYKNAREIFEQKQRGSYAQILELLIKATGCVKATPEANMTQSEIEFWLKEVMPLIFDADDDIQTNAIEAVNEAIPLLLASRHQTNVHWQQVRSNILSVYTKKINNCFKQGSPKWYMVWCLCVQLLDIDIPRSASTLNAFLSIVEPALRSNVPIRRAEGYLCWKVLLEVLVRHNRLNSEKRLKLMCTPLKSLQAKTVEIAINKFHAWWYVICNVPENVENYISMVFEPFLQFSFGPITATSNLSLDPTDAATQVKSFPDVSLMAITTFLRILDVAEKQLDELFAKFSLAQPSFTILTETIFSIRSSALIVINACGEATLMLNRLENDSSHNIDRITLSVCLWTRLFKHVNKAKNIEHINLILDNVLQLLQINSLNQNRTKMIPVVCSSIIGQVNMSFVFDQADGNVLNEDLINTISKLMNTMILLPSMQTRFNESLANVLVKSHDANHFEQNFTHFLIEIYDQFYKIEDNVDNTSEKFANKLVLSYKFIDCILQYIQANADNIKETLSDSENVQMPQVFYNILYWPLSLRLNRNEFDIFTYNLLKAVDLLLTVINKSEFCKGSAKTVKNIIESQKHCIYINDAIAVLFENMVYDFDDLKSAPLEMLDLCNLVINKDAKVLFQFQDLNSITEALIKYRRSITQQQFEIIASKLRDVLQLIDGESLRTKPGLVDDLKSLVGDENIAEKSPVQANKSLRSNKKGEKDDFVVVNKVWKLEPGKLTEHQKEKLKTRRCDIPALYNDLSKSQDSASIQAWAPKSMPADDSKDESNDDKKLETETSEATTGESPASQRAKKNTKTSPKRTNQSQSQPNNSVDRKGDSDKDASDEMLSKRRSTRELSRIQIDAKIEEVPYNSLPESNRLTRSTIKKIEEQPEVAKKRKTRSDSVKPTDIKTPDTKEAKKKITRASLANSPVPAKSKTKVNAKSAHATETEPSSGEPTPKRRQTRQSKTDELESEEPVQKVENKKTEFVDTLELRVEKLPINIPLKYDEKASDDSAKEGPKESEEPNQENVVQEGETEREDQSQNEEKDQCIAMEIDNTVAEQESNDIVNETPEPQQARTKEQLNHEMETEDAEIEPNSQILIETETVPNGDEQLPAEDACSPVEEQVDEVESEHNISSRSYMSALVFDGLSPSKSLNGSTIITSPEINAPRSLEFLNDTLNISPIVTESETVQKEGIAKKKKEVLDCIERTDSPVVLERQDVDGNTERHSNIDEIASEKESDAKKENETKIDDKNTIQRNAAPVPESPVVSSSSSKQMRTPLAIQSSTPIQSHHSPVSSKFRTQLMGRGAQLLKMINSNKSQKPASPTPTPVAENAFINITKTASPSINQLETAPICENAVRTPEPRSSKDRQAEKYEQNENGNFLTLSGVLPSPYESPGISILKRKCSAISMDDSMHSPAAKRKRVSFGFPLSHTKEYIIDEDFTPFYMLPSNDSPCRRANRIKKLKLKRNQNPNDSAKTLSTNSKKSRTNESNANTNVDVSHVKSDEISVKHIQEYLGMDMESYQAKQKNVFENVSEKPAINANTNDVNSDDSSTESNEDDPEIETVPPLSAKTLSEFSDDAIFSHLLSKYSPNDILKKFESAFDAKVLTKRLSGMMSSDKQVETSVLEELAEQHSDSFLEHAITENLCSVICDRLTVKSPNGITDYTTEKINNDEQYASDFLDRVSVSLLRQKLMDTVTTSKREQHILLDDFLTSLKDYISSTHRVSPKTVDTSILPEHIHLWVAKLFDQFKLSPEQYLQLTSIYIQNNPPQTLPLD